MNGCVIPGTPIAVDFWKIQQAPGARVFFLSHMHMDHTSGLTPSWCWPIYCSEVSKRLLIQKFEIQPQLIHALEVNQSHIIYLDKEKEVTMTTTVLDANHCPGSIMFHFEGYFGRILYTGDFRYDPSMFVDSPICLSQNIDVLYLDNTFCSPKCEFPARSVAEEEIVNIIVRHVEHNIVIGVRTLGKEDLLVKLAKNFQTWIGVSDSHYKTLEVLQTPNVFTTDRSKTWIRTLPLMQITRKRMYSLNLREPTIAILPTALYTGIDAEPYCNDPNVFIVPYSDHSCYSELSEFVQRVKPKKIIPIVKGSSRGVFGTSLTERANMTCFEKYLDNTPTEEFIVPVSVKNYMKGVLGQNVHHDKARKHVKRFKQKPPIQMKRKPSRGIVYETPEKVQFGIEEPEKIPSKKVKTSDEATASTQTCASQTVSHLPEGHRSSKITSISQEWPEVIEITNSPEKSETIILDDTGGTDVCSLEITDDKTKENGVCEVVINESTGPLESNGVSDVPGLNGEGEKHTALSENSFDDFSRENTEGTQNLCSTPFTTGGRRMLNFHANSNLLKRPFPSPKESITNEISNNSEDDNHKTPSEGILSGIDNKNPRPRWKVPSVKPVQSSGHRVTGRSPLRKYISVKPK